MLITLILHLAVSLSAKAEYRVYLLRLTNTETLEETSLISTLDSIQYPQYHPVPKNTFIEIEDSWFCYERGDFFQPHCEKPQNPDQDNEAYNE